MNQRLISRWAIGLAGSLSFLVHICAAFAQAPSDFHLIATSGGLFSQAEIRTVIVETSGALTYTRYVSDDPGADPLDTYTATLTAQQRNDLWTQIQSSGVLTSSDEVDEEMKDGTFAWLVVTANGATVQVTAQNAVHAAVSQALDALNATLPDDKRLVYEPSPSFNWEPVDDCWNYANKRDLISYGKGSNESSTLLTATIGEEHAGTTAANRLSLTDAVRRRLVSLEGKGGYTGDKVSIGANNTTAQTSNDLVVKLYFEFWGAEANADVANRVKQAIETTWSGKQTTGGKTLKVQVVTIVAPGSASAPGTAGYHQIKVDSNLPYSSATLFQNYSGAGIGNFQPNGAKIDKTWAHEAGHLMGNPDHYDDYRKQPDGMWRREGDGQTFAAQQVAATLARKYPGRTALQMLNWLNQAGTTRTSTPQDGHENDLMATLDGAPSQEDVDAIADRAGLLVEVKPGSILVNRNGNDQNFAVTRQTDLFIPKGETKVVNGLWVVCIDHHDGIPDYGQVFDVAPPLSDWAGYDGASQLERLLAVGDSLHLYCDWYMQAAVWRLTDNSSVGDPSVDALLALAGIVAGDQQFEFPRMSSPVTDDSPPHTLVPVELFKTSCDPTSVLTTPGFQVNVRGIVNGPSAEGAVFTHRWGLERPYGSAAALTDSTAEVASFIPDIRGTYRLDLRIQVEMPGVSTTFLEGTPLFVTAADDATETFEENALTTVRPFAWRNDENVPWTIETGMAFTGSRTVATGPIDHGQKTDLAIRVFLPLADSLHFAVSTSTEDNWDYLDFVLDDTVVARWSGETAWTTATIGIPAGEHHLTWRYTKDGSVSYGLDRAWVDDIFFPVDAVTTPVESTDEPAWTFALEAPYPNPARETATLVYTLTSDEEVSLDLFDVLGRKVVTVVRERRARGRHQEIVDTRGLSAGLLVAVLRAGDRVETRALLVAR